MAILIGVWESILVLAILLVLTALAVSWCWRRRLAALRQDCDRRHQAELANLREEYDQQRQTERAALRKAYDRQQQAEIHDLIREFRHQASHCLMPIKDNLHQIRREMETDTPAGTMEGQQSLTNLLRDIKGIEKYEWRLTRLIDNMAFVSYLEAPDSSLPFHEVKLDVIVSDVVSEFQDSAEEERIQLAWWARPEGFPRIMANDEGLWEVFINLVDNAIKYCQEDGEVDVALKANEAKNVIYARVSDTGPGIPKEDWERIFEKAYTVEGARGRKPKEGSQGLGLYIVKLVVEKHKGTIEVTSELGKGTTFTITLPIQRV